MAEAGTLDKSQLNGPVDHGVELLVARTIEGGEALAVVFGYACHATVLGLQSLHGDWPGRAMATLEAAHPSGQMVALHINGCSGDANPLPRCGGGLCCLQSPPSPPPPPGVLSD